VKKPMNTTRSLPAPKWQAYFDEISKCLAGERAFVQIEGLAFGDQTQAKCLPLIGLTYDPKGGLLEIAMEGLDHLIHRPREIVVSEGAEGLECLSIIDSHDQKQNIRLVKPLRYAHRR
jgi:hypothetical protein